MEKPIVAPEMRIYDQQGKRLYLSREERGVFLGDVLSILKDTVRLTDSVERLNSANNRLQDKVDGINERVIRLEARLDTYVEIASKNRLEH